MGVVSRYVNNELSKLGFKKKKVNKNSKIAKKARSAKKKLIKKLHKDRQAVLPSSSEKKIIDFFVSEGVKFEREVPFLGLNSAKGYPLFFDFYLPDFRLMIEFNGYHHYDKNNPNYTNQRENDRRKYVFCKKWDYDFLAIPFWLDPLTEICKKLDQID